MFGGGGSSEEECCAVRWKECAAGVAAIKEMSVADFPPAGGWSAAAADQEGGNSLAIINAG
jgi:hypothetical protein